MNREKRKKICLTKHSKKFIDFRHTQTECKYNLKENGRNLILTSSGEILIFSFWMLPEKDQTLTFDIKKQLSLNLNR